MVNARFWGVSGVYTPLTPQNLGTSPPILQEPKIIAVFWEVLSESGYGFSEKVYENPFVIAINDAGYKVEPQKKIKRLIYDNDMKTALIAPQK